MVFRVVVAAVTPFSTKLPEVAMARVTTVKSDVVFLMVNDLLVFPVGTGRVIE